DPASVAYVEADSSARAVEDRAEAPILASFFCSKARNGRCYVGSVKADIGHTGAASGLVGIVKASLALYQEIIPGLRGLRHPIPELAGEINEISGRRDHPNSPGLVAPVLPQCWVRDRLAGPRRAGVSCSSVDGNVMHVALEGCEEQRHSVVSA